MSDGSRQAVTNKKKLEEVAQEMNQLLDKNSIVCCQESDGVFDQLVEVAEARGIRHTSLFEGIMTFWNPLYFELVEEALEPIWPHGIGCC